MRRISSIIVLTFTLIITVSSSQKSIFWSGYHWHIRDSLKSAPGPNNWGSSNVWVDSRNRLHLKMNHSADTGEWYCAELRTYNNFSYGTYRWKIQGRLDLLNQNVVLGLFSYQGPSGSNEIDIEIAEWAEKIHQPKNLYYTVWPRNVTGPPRSKAHHRFSLTGSWTTHSYKWTSDKVTFVSQHGFQDSQRINRIFAYETPSSFNKYIPETSLAVQMNLWAYEGRPPTNGKDVEVIIYEFTYTPA